MLRQGGSKKNSGASRQGYLEPHMVGGYRFRCFEWFKCTLLNMVLPSKVVSFQIFQKIWKNTEKNFLPAPGFGQTLGLPHPPRGVGGSRAPSQSVTFEKVTQSSCQGACHGLSRGMVPGIDLHNRGYHALILKCGAKISIVALLPSTKK